MTPRHLFPLLIAASLRGADPASAAVEITVRDYIEGYFSGDAARMGRALHPDLAKRRIQIRNGKPHLISISAQSLVQGTQEGWGIRLPPKAKQIRELKILDLRGDLATVVVDSGAFLDYCHLARIEGTWKIINVLWTSHPELP